MFKVVRKIVILTLALVFGVWQISAIGQHSAAPSASLKRDNLPPHVKVAFANIYELVGIYRRENNKYPTGLYPLILRRLNAAQTPDEYTTFLKKFINPDNIQADDPSMRRIPDKSISYVLNDKRPNGEALGSAKILHTRDLLAYTYIYSHSKGVEFEGNVITTTSGFYGVLWDDGVTEKVPVDDVFYFDKLKIGAEPSYSVIYPSEAGVPWDCFSYEEFKVGLSNQPSLPLTKPNPITQKTPVADNGGPESLVQLSRFMSVPDFYGIEREKMWALLDPAQPEFSLSEIQQTAVKLGLPSQVKKASLNELAAIGAPAVLFLSDDKRQVAVAALSDKYAVVIDRGITRIVTRELLEKRYSGEAMVPQSAIDKAAALRAENGLQQITIDDVKKEIPVQAVLKNTGGAPLELQIEQPIPGCLKAQLSSETIAPGAQVTLTATVKWREILKTTAQNVIIWVKSNDPARPRLPIGIRLALPQKPTATNTP